MENEKREDFIDLLEAIISEHIKTNPEEADKMMSALASGIMGITPQSALFGQYRRSPLSFPVYNLEDLFQLAQLREKEKELHQEEDSVVAK